MLALIGNLDFLEILVIAAVAIMVFGRELPKVAMRGAAHLMKLRREVSRMWREAGLEEELRKVRRDLDKLPEQLPTADELIRYEEQQELLEHPHHEEAHHEEASPEDVGAVEPIDPLSREALAGEPAETEPAPGAEDAFDDPTQVGRTEPAEEEYAYEEAAHEEQAPDGPPAEEPGAEPSLAEPSADGPSADGPSTDGDAEKESA